MNHANILNRPPMLVALAVVVTLVGCKGSEDSSVTVQGDVPIAYVKRSTALMMNATDGTPTAPGGDLMIREKSSPSAREINITESITQGQGDVSDPEVSYDAKKIVFAMRCPTSNTANVPGTTQRACTGRWNIWEYDMSAGLANGTLRRITSSTTDDDVDPVYLPGGRGFVFSSNRQSLTRTSNGSGGFNYAVDEYERERVIQLHTMDANGGNIQQISVNQSHDRNPVIRPNGDIMFSRWEHVGNRNRFAVFTVKPDGTNMFVFYGAHSPGNSFLHPRDMDPAGPYKGYVLSSLVPLTAGQEGGGLMLVDAANYSEQNTPANPTVRTQGGQIQWTDKELSLDRGVSQFGRVTSPYPLWDGTNRVLLAWRPCQVTRNGVITPCAQLTDAERAMLGDMSRTRAQRALDPVQDNAPAAYGIYMFDPATKQMLPVATPPAGFMYTDPIALQPRAEPNVAQPTLIDQALASRNPPMALIEVRSVYDTDGLDRMGDSMLAAADRPNGCTVSIPKRAPEDAVDTRAQVADLRAMKDPANAAYRCAPAYFVRAARAVAPTANAMGMREAIGETDFEPQQILGYAPIEPDGSFKLEVPADTPIALSILDAKGRAIQTHLNWIQVRPGERRTCDGCHSPRRGASLNSTAVVNTTSQAWLASMLTGRQSGETMASTRTRMFPSALNLQADPVFSDVWADTGRGYASRGNFAIRYTGNGGGGVNDLGTPIPTNGVINYPDHIQPIWERARTGGSCVSCHQDTAPGGLDLRNTTSGTGRLTSYQELLVGDPLIDPATGLPVTVLRDGVPVIERKPALVETMSGNAGGLARMSRLTEILFGEELKASPEARAEFPMPTLDHSTMLNLAEKRLITEWLDLGGQYFNNPGASGSPLRTVNPLSRTAFDATIFPILQSTCASCHQPSGSSGAAQTTVNFARNRFALTGSLEGDYNVTLSLVSNTCAPATNLLLARPSDATLTTHPPAAVGGTTPVLPAGSANYNAISNWIQSGC